MDIIFAPPRGRDRLIADLNIESQHRSAVNAARAAAVAAAADSLTKGFDTPVTAGVPLSSRPHMICSSCMRH